MPISAVVIQLSPEDAFKRDAIDQLSRDERVTLGDLQVHHLPAVLETQTLFDSIDLVRKELPAIPGVEFVHVVSVDFSDVDPNEMASAKISHSKHHRGAS